MEDYCVCEIGRFWVLEQRSHGDSYQVLQATIHLRHNPVQQISTHPEPSSITDPSSIGNRLHPACSRNPDGPHDSHLHPEPHELIWSHLDHIQLFSFLDHLVSNLQCEFCGGVVEVALEIFKSVFDHFAGLLAMGGMLGGDEQVIVVVVVV